MRNIEVTAIGMVAVVILSLIGLFLTVINLPGNWVILAGALIYGYITEFKIFSVAFLVGLIVLVLVGELAEFLAGMLGAKRAKATKFTLLMTLVGSVIGTLIGTAILPVIGSFFGALAGALVFSYVAEYTKIGSGTQAFKVAKYAVFGQFVGMVSKWLIGLMLVIGIVIQLFI